MTLFQMPPDEEHNLHQLLTCLDAAGLGVGDVDSGTSLPAAMAITLAILSRPGSDFCRGNHQPASPRLHGRA
jgi:hypothetical protein